MSNLQQRLNRKTYVQNGHLLWGGALDAKGYGVIRTDGYYAKTERVHRVAWEIAFGPIPRWAWVLHRCDTPPCVLPWHLYLGTPTDNTEDTIRAGRMHFAPKTHCPQGHPYDEENTYIYSASGGRYCRTCRKIRSKKWYKNRATDGR